MGECSGRGSGRATVRRHGSKLGRIGATLAVALVGLVFSAGVAPTSGSTVTGELRAATFARRTPVPSQPEVRRVVVLYGDSLSWESQDHFVAAFAAHPEVEIETRTFGGTAICDFLDDMRTDARQLRPDAVVVEFSGNAFTDCMKDATGRPLSGEAYLERYRVDAAAVVATFEPIGTRIYFAGSPIPRPSEGDPHYNGGRLDGMYEELAEVHAGSVEFVDAGAAVLDDGRWTATLPCRPVEPCVGGTDADGRPVDVVRAPDGNHFCPSIEPPKAGTIGACAVWSSGADRFGRAMAAPVVAALTVPRTSRS